MLSKLMAVLLLLLNLLFMQVTGAFIHRAGYCAFSGDCGKNPEVTNSLLPARVPCLYNGPALNLSQAHLELLKKVCPTLHTEDSNPRACCSTRQLKMLDSSLTISKTLLVRCPSCVQNFINLYCQNTCSPNQSLHINVTRTFMANVLGQLKEAVLEYQCYYTREFADGAYDSCKNVRIPATGGFAISPMCGKYGAALCNTERWLGFQGDSSNGLAPLDIDFILVGNRTEPGGRGIVPYGGPFWRCNESASAQGQACSCQDCPKSCPPIPVPLPPPGPWEIGSLPGTLVVCLLAFFSLLVLFALFLTCRRALRSRRAGKAPPALRGAAGCSHKVSQATQLWLTNGFRRWGTAVARHPLLVIGASVIVVVVLSAGLTYITLTTDPVQLWSAPDSRARREKEFHDANFGPFFRTDQIILTVRNRSDYTYDSILFGKNKFSGIFSKDILLELLDFQTRLQNIEVWSEKAQRNISLKDICYAPLNPQEPRTTDCAVNSLLQYFQNNRSRINAVANQTMGGKVGTVDWRDHFLYCVNSPLSFKDNTAMGMSCMADYGAPVFPFLAVGGYTGEDFTQAQAFIMTFSLNSYHSNDPKYEYALLWEKEYLKILQQYKQNESISFSFVYMAERSLEDEINRTTAEDIPIFAISYLVIFVYIALALGEYTSWRTIMIDSKITLGLGGILVVLGAVLSSMGFYAYIGVPSSLVILEVVPFLVLAVGADNIFILVLQYQRDERRAGECREEQIGRVLGDVAPSMLLCSFSESVCFFLGALTKMPAVRTFALYAALAVFLDFLLQMSAFVALLSLDVRREEAARFDICCCVHSKNRKKKKRREGFLLTLMRKYYAPFLLHSVTRIIVIIIFLFMLCSGIFLMLHVRVGLDQELALPTDSYMLDYFAALNKYFEVGVPVYFVTTAGYNFSSIAGINGVCSSVGCDNNSMTQKIQYATEFPKESYMAIPASSWVDDFIDWLNPMSRCCRLFIAGPNAGKFCPATNNQLLCFKKCLPPNLSGIIRPTSKEFDKYLPNFLNDTPTLECSKGGLGAYGNAVKRDKGGEILASRFMAYHVPLKNSLEYTAALKAAREIADSITESMRKVPGTDPNFEVFPYTITYVYYEQYLTVVNEGIFNIGICLIPTFVVCCILLGMDIQSGFLNLVTIIMIIVDTVGAMTLWNIDFNAVSLINLVTAVGMSVEFVSHLTRSFAVSTKESKVERAKEATVTMGSAVFAGVALTNLPGIIVLYFAKAQLIQIFFFRLNLVITLLGLVHGLVFLPVLLSYFGPNVKTAAISQPQADTEPPAENEYCKCFPSAIGHNDLIKDEQSPPNAQCNGSAGLGEHTVSGHTRTSVEKEFTSSETHTNRMGSTVTSF
ncbi:NPC1-like intracellular cholesterol transporter 1 [Pristis pectinata]|uniref:NPC1-like intracellular cholesterol transporter 1 n=1 Tax=Pristis pectinata TaxID=685728 RepID=UPI00223D025E|nr:NPC1-like intracellular cholesterol transporter 1 [Pristis pectinata]